MISDTETRDTSTVIEKPQTNKMFGIGIDNIRFGMIEYQDKSIYVSKPISMEDPFQVGLKVLEKRPASEEITMIPEMVSTTYNDADTMFYHCSIEYYIFKIDYNSYSNILATYKIPILPTNVSRINHERFLVTERSHAGLFLPDTGFLRFFAYEDTADIKLYRNGYQMNTSEYSIETTSDDSTPNMGYPMRTRITITALLAGDIFTVSYNPSESSSMSVPTELSAYTNSGINVVDLTGDLTARLVTDKLVLLDKNKWLGKEVKKSDLHMGIILRNNVGNLSLTAAVEEYNLVFGERDLEKFSGGTF